MTVITYKRREVTEETEPSGDEHVDRMFFKANRKGRYAVSFDDVHNLCRQLKRSDTGETEMTEEKKRVKHVLEIVGILSQD